ncbi:uncharacterized protein LOC115938063 [Leptonychotes weddellii]|uniref:Uncharacterized protein LOC115938063 n=1 Tax=Leptonychotes weddellii TaxID=9713 RepID=A0A7F8Q9U0_LEPWE|nr:uncharacterized protein LOC115938063 [Leptonychotes weddellii]
MYCGEEDKPGSVKSQSSKSGAATHYLCDYGTPCLSSILCPMGMTGVSTSGNLYSEAAVATASSARGPQRTSARSAAQCTPVPLPGASCPLRSGGSALDRAVPFGGPSASRPPMLSATRRASQLFPIRFPVSRMGDSASKTVSPQEALPGRKEPIPVTGVCALSAGVCASLFLSLVYGPLGYWPLSAMVPCCVVTGSNGMIQNDENCSFEIVSQTTVPIARIILRLPLSSLSARFLPIGRRCLWPRARGSAAISSRRCRFKVVLYKLKNNFLISYQNFRKIQ